MDRPSGGTAPPLSCESFSHAYERVDQDGDHEQKYVKISEKSGVENKTCVPKEERDVGQEMGQPRGRSESAESGCFQDMRMDREHRGQSVGAEEQA